MAPGGHSTWLAKGTGFCNFSAAKLVKGHQKQLATTAATWAGPAWEGSWHRGGGQSDGSGARRPSSFLSAQASWGQRRAFCLLSPTESGPRGWQIFPVHRQGKQGSEQLSDLPRVTQLAVADARPTSPVQFLGFHLSVQGPPSRVLVSRWAPREGRPRQGSQKSWQLVWRPADEMPAPSSLAPPVLGCSLTFAHNS